MSSGVEVTSSCLCVGQAFSKGRNCAVTHTHCLYRFPEPMQGLHLQGPGMGGGWATLESHTVALGLGSFQSCSLPLRPHLYWNLLFSSAWWLPPFWLDGADRGRKPPARNSIANSILWLWLLILRNYLICFIYLFIFIFIFFLPVRNVTFFETLLPILFSLVLLSLEEYFGIKEK